MIQINLLSKRDKAMIAARLAIYNRSFSERNPALGKMVNCDICDRRHRDSIICVPKYATGRYAPHTVMIAPDTVGGIVGRAQFKGRRRKQHHKARALQLVQLTQKLYPQYEAYITDPVECMKLARRDAARILKTRALAFESLREPSRRRPGESMPVWPDRVREPFFPNTN